MQAVRKIRRVGNSLMVPIPPDHLRESGFEEGMDVTLTAAQGRVEIGAREVPDPDVAGFAARFTVRYREDLAALANL